MKSTSERRVNWSKSKVGGPLSPSGPLFELLDLIGLAIVLGILMFCR